MLQGRQVLAVLLQVVQVDGAQRVLDVGIGGVSRVPDQRRQVQRVSLGVIGVPGSDLAGGQLPQQFPQERHVEMMAGAADREVVQLARGQRVEIVQVAHSHKP